MSCYRCPLKVEPARSGRSKCKGCHQTIAKGALRITITKLNYNRPFSRYIHMECTAAFGFNLNNFASESIECPRRIEGWNKLTAEQKQVTLRTIYGMDVSVEDIIADRIPQTKYEIERERRENALTLRTENSNRNNYIKSVQELATNLKKYGFNAENNEVNVCSEEKVQNTGRNTGKKRKRGDSDGGEDEEFPSKKRRKVESGSNVLYGIDTSKLVNLTQTRSLMKRISDFVKTNKERVIDCDGCDGIGHYCCTDHGAGFVECWKCKGKTTMKMNEWEWPDLEPSWWSNL